MMIEPVPVTICGDILLKILIINYEFPPLGGGGGVATMDLALEWVKTAQVDVLTSWFKGLPYYERVQGINVYRVPIFFRKSRDAASFLSMLSYLPFGFFKGLRLCLKNRYDVINTHFAVPSGPLGYTLGLIFRIPNVLSLHGGDIYDPSKKMSPHRSIFWRNVVRFIMNRADRIIAQSSNTRDNALKYYAPRREVGIIPLAFHPPLLSGVKRATLGFKKNEFLLITIGRLIKRKAIDHMIRALAAVPDARVRLLVLGDGPEREFLESLARELGLGDRVVFAGYVTEEQKYDFIEVSNVFISTSLHEGFGIVFMEAMYCGLPIICSNHGGQVDFLKNGENALLVDVGDIEGYARSIRRFIDDDGLFKRCSANNRMRVKDFYAENVAARYTHLYKEVSGNRE
jgi:glycosyltransferase involved in cell wall biosynthesis